MAAQSLSDTEFHRLMISLSPPRRLALAVSGGGDSMALLCLVARWRESHAPQGEISVLTVNHGLRAQAHEEAALVAKAAARLGFKHHVLHWRETKPSTGLQEAARQARYALMSEWCAGNGVDTLMTAHTLDDQAETVLMRLTRASGIDGLAGMAARNSLFGMTLLRPLLGIERARLRATLTMFGQEWAEDSSNEDPRFTRVRLRQAMPELAKLGVTQKRLIALAREAAGLRSVLDAATADFLKVAVRQGKEGFYVLDAGALNDAFAPVALRALKLLLLGAGGALWPARTAALQQLYDGVKIWVANSDEEALGRGRTLGGCKIVPQRQRHLLFIRETGRLKIKPVPLEPGETRSWDRRFFLSLPATPPATGGQRYYVGALGQGLGTVPRQLVQGARSRLSRLVLEGLPALRGWDGELLNVPHLGFVADTAQYTPAAAFSASFHPGLAGSQPILEAAFGA